MPAQAAPLCPTWTRPAVYLIALLGAALLLPGAASAQGTIVIERPVRPPWRPNVVTTMPLVLKTQRVEADIVDGVAVTRVEQSFVNPMSTAIEGTYIFPLPDGAAVSDFSMTVGGKTLRGEVLEADQARRTYEDIVRRARDPGLLEYLGSRLYRASVFPIPPGSRLDVKLQYTQTLSESGGLGLLRHPARGDQPGAPPIEQWVVQVRIKSTLPLASVFSPSHKCDIRRPSDNEAVVVFEQSQARADADFLLYYQRKDAAFGLSLLTHRPAGDAGYFLLRLSPRVESRDEAAAGKDLAIVVDTSGSMAGAKMEQARRALRFCINALSGKDRFNVYGFSTEVHPFRDGLVTADAEVKQAALDYADGLQALGGTNINQALLAALNANPRVADRPYLVVFLTDGEPTVDVTDPEKILANVAERNPPTAGRVRFHVLGVGTQVNTHLLDKLAETTRGARDYCTENEDLELKLSAFVTRLANPVLTDVSLLIDGLNTFDVYPRELPDLFRGGELLVLGRYDGEGHRAVEFRGSAGGRVEKVTYEGAFPRVENENAFLPRLWATRKVGYLLDQIRLHGANRELTDEVVRLAKRHGIVTPYTSALILEDEPRTMQAGLRGAPAVAGREERVLRLAERAGGDGSAGKALGGRGAFGTMREGAAAAAPESNEERRQRAVGGAAVEASRRMDEMKGMAYLGATSDADRALRDETGERVVRHVLDKTFIHDGERWVDSAWDGKRAARKVQAFSDEYFALLKQHRTLAKFLALGPRVVVLIGDEVIETTTAEGEP